MTKSLIALALSVATVAAASRAQAPQATFRAGADFVSVDVSVRRGGRPVTGLTAADFEIVDNGIRQEVADLSYEKLPIDVTVALDVSGSVSGAVLDQLRRAVQQLRADLGARDRLKLQTFNMRIARLTDFVDPAASPDAAFDHLSGSGSTAIFDAIAVALSTPVPVDRRRLVVVFSDGDDSSSISDSAVLLDVARHTTPTVAVVLAASSSLRTPAAPAPNSPAAALRAVYDQLAADTGGAVVPMHRGDNLTAAFRRVLDEFRTSYVLHFRPQGVDRAGTHTLGVRVSRAGVDVRARRTYVWR